MQLVTRRSVLQLGAATLALGFKVPTATAADFNLKLGTSLPSSDITVGFLRGAADKIGKDTNGKVDLKIFPDSLLGSDPDMLSQLRSGALSMFSGTTGSLGTLVTSAALTSIGFAFASYDEVWKAVDGDLGAYVRGALEKVGIVALPGMFDTGFRQITTSNTPIKSVADLSGLKMRVSPSPIYAAMFRDLGTSPTTIAFGETYSALQTRLVDGQENPLSLIQSAKFYEVQKFCSLTNHAWDGPLMCVNKTVWQRMPKDVQDIIASAFKEAALAQRAAMAARTKELQESLTSAGLTFVAPDVGGFRDKLAKSGFYAEMKKKFGDESWGVLEKNSNIRV